MIRRCMLKIVVAILQHVTLGKKNVCLEEQRTPHVPFQALPGITNEVEGSSKDGVKAAQDCLSQC